MILTMPITMIEKLLKSLERRDKKIATYSSISIAKIAGLLNGDIDPIEIMPFKDIDDDSSKNRKSKILEPETIEILKGLIKRKMLPNHIYPILEPWSSLIFEEST